MFLDAVGSGPDAALLRTNDVVANTVGVRNLAVETVDADRNWWGAVNGPGGDGPGNGDPIYGSATFAGWLHSSARDDSDADGLSECAGDCDDTNAWISPAQPELCNGIDDDCDGTADEGVTYTTWYRDADADLYGNASVATETCTGTPPAGYVADGADCNDANAAIHPGARDVLQRPGRQGL